MCLKQQQQNLTYQKRKKLKAQTMKAAEQRTRYELMQVCRKTKRRNPRGDAAGFCLRHILVCFTEKGDCFDKHESISLVTQHPVFKASFCSKEMRTRYISVHGGTAY